MERWREEEEEETERRFYREMRQRVREMGGRLGGLSSDEDDEDDEDEDDRRGGGGEGVVDGYEDVTRDGEEEQPRSRVVRVRIGHDRRTIGENRSPAGSPSTGQDGLQPTTPHRGVVIQSRVMIDRFRQTHTAPVLDSHSFQRYSHQGLMALQPPSDPHQQEELFEPAMVTEQRGLDVNLEGTVEQVRARTENMRLSVNQVEQAFQEMARMDDRLRAIVEGIRQDIGGGVDDDEEETTTGEREEGGSGAAW
ncbi:hypothetical protein BST61_g11524 [Cercospora zeina]